MAKTKGYRWNEDDCCWYRRLNEETGKYPDRAAEIGHELLRNGYAICIHDAEITEKAITGDYEKERVREIAKEIGIDVHNKPDSQEICFVKDNDYAGDVKKHSKKRIEEGYFVDTKGNVLGKHKGIVNYTIGQRKGLGIAFGKPMFVIDINAKKNTVVLGDNEDLFNKVVIAKDVNLIAFDEITEPVRVEAKIRYSAKPSPATVYKIDNNKIKIVFDEPQRAITKGQSVVMYNGDVVVGGGIIC